MQKIKEVVLLLSSAVLLILSTPGFDCYYFAFVALVPFFYLLESLNLKRSIIFTYFFSVILYTITLSWIVITVSDFGNAPKIIGFLILILFASYLSIYWLLFVYFYKKRLNILFLSVIFVALELIRGFLFTGFPWINLGITQYNNNLLIKLYSIVGENGVSFIIILTNLLLYNLITSRKLIYLFSVICLIVFVFIVNISINYDNNGKKVNIAAIQPAYSQKEKWNPNKKEELINKVLNMFNSLEDNFDLIIMPESIFPTFCNEDKWIIDYLRKNKKSDGVIFGCLRYEKKEKIRYYNSVFFIDNETVNFYDKIHLVPFGEYFPFKNLLKPIEYYFFKDSEDFSAGNKFTVFKSNNLAIATPICYESAYSSIVRKFFKKGANLFVFLSNDSWFGNSKGRYQHLAIDIIRAFEFNRTIVRGTQSGISACIDPFNKKVVSLGIDESGILKCSLPVLKKSTVFSRYAYIYLLFLFFIGIIFELYKRNLLIKFIKKYIRLRN